MSHDDDCDDADKYLKPLYLIFFILMPHQFLYKPYLLQPHHASTLFLKCAKVYHFGVCGH